MINMKNCNRRPITELLETIVDNRGKSVPTVEEGFPLIATNCIKHSSIYPTFENIRYVSDEVLNNWFRAALKPNDILFVNKGTPGRVCLVPEPVNFCAAQDMVGLRCDPKKVYYKYLFAVLRSESTQKIIGNYHVGIAIPHFKKSDMQNLLIPLPDRYIQEKIGNMYFTLSEKIELNNKIRHELENLIITIYDYWFVQFNFPNEEGKPYKLSSGRMGWNEELQREIPHDWRVDKLEELGEIVAGGTPSTRKPDYYCENGIAWITPNDLSNTSNKYISHGQRDITELGLKESSAKLMPKGSVLISTRAPIGYMAIALNEVSTNQGFKSVVPKPEYGSEYVYYTVKSNIKGIEQMGCGTTFMEVSKSSISNYKILFPPQHLIDMFNSRIKSISEKMIQVESENRELVQLRDWLLPMLMNGQISFKD